MSEHMNKKHILQQIIQTLQASFASMLIDIERSEFRSPLFFRVTQRTRRASVGA